MKDQVWKEFFTDTQTDRALDNSEVFKAYAKTEILRDDLRKKNAVLNALEQETSALNEIDEFNKKIAANPLLKAKLKQARDHLEMNPELIKTVDPNFIRGLQLLDLDEE